MKGLRKMDVEPDALLGGGLDITGRQVAYFGQTWTIAGKNYLGDWEVVRHPAGESGPVKVTSSIDALILPEDHPHYASLLVTH